MLRDVDRLEEELEDSELLALGDADRLEEKLEESDDVTPSKTLLLLSRDSEMRGHKQVKRGSLVIDSEALEGAVVAKSLEDILLKTDVLSLSDIERLAEALVLLLLLLPLLEESDNEVLGHAQVSPSENVEPVVETETLALRDDE